MANCNGISHQNGHAYTGYEGEGPQAFQPGAPDRDFEREINDLLRSHEQLTQENAKLAQQTDTLRGEIHTLKNHTNGGTKTRSKTKASRKEKAVQEKLEKENAALKAQMEKVNNAYKRLEGQFIELQDELRRVEARLRTETHNNRELVSQYNNLAVKYNHLLNDRSFFWLFSDTPQPVKYIQEEREQERGCCRISRCGKFTIAALAFGCLASHPLTLALGTCGALVWATR